jgi:hypothetical protein
VSILRVAPTVTDPIVATPSATDLDSDPISYTYTWSRNATLVAGETAATYAGPRARGDTLTVQATARDNGGLATVADTSVTVINSAPTAATQLSGSTRMGATTTVTLVGTDPDTADTLTFALDGANGGAGLGTVLLTGAVATYTPIRTRAVRTASALPSRTEPRPAPAR